MHILVTRPIAQALKTRERLEAFGHEVSLAPMLEIVFPACPELDAQAFQAITVTSSNALEGLVQRPDRDLLCALPLYAVGDRTAQRAERMGWHRVRSASGAVDDLTSLLQSEFSPGADRILYACGVDRTGDLDTKLIAAGFDVTIAEVYHARAVGDLQPTIAEALRQRVFDAIFVYSARTASVLLDAVHEADLLEAARDTVICAFSEAVAAPFRSLGFENIVVSSQPSERILFKELCLQG